MSRPVILAIDIGSSSVRAALFDHSGKALPRKVVKRNWEFVPTSDGGSEMNAIHAFGGVCEVIDSILSQHAGSDVEISHIAMCSFWHSLMGIDARDRPTTPVLGWADTRSREYSATLKERFDEVETHNRTGAHFHSGFWPTKLLWLRNERRQAFDRTVKWLGFVDYVTMRFTGEIASSISMASATGLFDQRKLRWDAELFRFSGIKHSQVARIFGSDASVRLTRKLVKRWPQLANTRLLPPVGDGAADHFGACGIEKGNASLMVGTSAATRVAYSGEPPARIPQGLWCYRVDEQRPILGGALSDGGNLIEWCRRRFQVPANFELELQRRDPLRQLPTVLPYFHGERSTGYREDARGAILDLLPTHDGVDVLDASMRAIAASLAEIYERLMSVAPIDRVAASGGALRESAYFREKIADALGRELEMSGQRESALHGLVQLAIERIGR